MGVGGNFTFFFFLGWSLDQFALAETRVVDKFLLTFVGELCTMSVIKQRRGLSECSERFLSVLRIMLNKSARDLCSQLPG